MLKRLCTALALVLSLSVASTALAAEKTYVNGIDASYPPFAFVDKDGKPSGFDVDSMNWIADKMGFKIKHVPMNWDTIIVSLTAKKIDMVCSGMSISPERKKAVTFSNPYYSVRKYLMVRSSDNFSKNTILTGKKKIGVQRGTNESAWLEKNKKANKWNFKLVNYGSAIMAAEDLVNGRIDCAAIDSAPANEAMNQMKMPIKVAGEFADADDFGVATRNEDVELRTLINMGYEQLMKDPYWQTLKTKYGVQ